MCGIVGYIGPEDALEVIISGLEKLEYRGYDSAGVALIEQDNSVNIIRSVGKLSELKKEVKKRDNDAHAHLGIGHTRWATHGRPSTNNAHPHRSGRVSLIHNGIIENYLELREELQAEGYEFLSETDTEIAAHLLHRELERGSEPFDALKSTCSHIRGSYAFVALDSEHPDRLLVAKNATPIVIGQDETQVIVASDIPAVLNYTREVLFLEDGDCAELSIGGIRVENSGKAIEREVQRIAWDPVTAQKGGYKHYMLKEIHDQAQVIAETFRGRIQQEKSSIVLPELEWEQREIESIERIVLVACGTAWHACLTAKFYIEQLAKIPCEVDYASEFRYREPVLDEKTLVMAISQSGETADTLAALDLAQKAGSPTFAVCNVLGSSIARKVDRVLFTHAGPEISVASTKAFTTQLTAVYILAMYLAEQRGALTSSELQEHIGSLIHLPGVIEQAVKGDEQIRRISREYYTASDFLYLGRGNCYPIALEGALKLKEISYIHAEGYPAGEMKHGPIALIDEKMPVVVVLQKSDIQFEKTLSNLREVESRRGRIIAVTDDQGRSELSEVCEEIIEVPFLSGWLSPIVLTIPLQLLAYHIAVMNGTDVDLPRNLAKSVTVE